MFEDAAVSQGYIFVFGFVWKWSFKTQPGWADTDQIETQPEASLKDGLSQMLFYRALL